MAVLVRRIRRRSGAEDVVCVGTSANYCKTRAIEKPAVSGGG